MAVTFAPLLRPTSRGLYCEAGDFYVDPTRPVDRAIVTHAHSDHARWGCRRYLAAAPSETLLRMRLSEEAEFQFLPYGESILIGGVRVSFHPAGHMLGSAQVRLEYRGKIAVVTGDYKLSQDPTCQPWEPVKCHLMVTETTFGLPIYRWPPADCVRDEINRWWRRCRDDGKCCVLYGYAVGKSQSLLAGLDPSLGPIFTHGAVEKGTQAYRQTGVALPETRYVGSVEGKPDWSGAMVVAVPSAHGTPWIRRFGRISTAMASGWMAVRGSRRRRAMDRGFVASDHVDWQSLLEAIDQCDPETVWATHGYTAAVARFLNENGREAHALESGGRREEDEDAIPPADESTG
ncbi:ligase-associated DNA damage response exonuclease [Stieleria maiorica]|uniref:ligase-associated DNA damage response exonuclease n=1 Tax=Stieleria maiorica TaxID=2795974 RepID=UPI0028F3F92C|nr:ligase-associated DNA damage response exonuclease [Stieleria maiorica]